MISMRHLAALAALPLLALVPAVTAADVGIQAGASASMDASAADAGGAGFVTADSTSATALEEASVPISLPLGVNAGADAHVRGPPAGDARSGAPSVAANVRAGLDAVAANVPEVVEDVAPPALALVGVAALAQAFGAWRFAGLGVFALYSRLSRSELLDNAHRDGVYKLIQETPGLGVSEITQRSGLGWGTTVYHLERLERAGFVASQRAGLHRCYFPVGTVPRAAREGLGALKGETARDIAVFLVARPGATQTDLCAALNLSASVASKQVTKLETAGLVRRERDWKTVHLFPEAALPDLLAGGQTSTPLQLEPQHESAPQALAQRAAAPVFA